MMNKAFVNYLDQLDNLTSTLDVPIIIDKITFQKTLPISLNVSNFDSNLLTTPKMLKDFDHHFHHKKEIIDLQERHTITDQEMPNKNFFLNSSTIDVFLFITAIISLLVTTLVMYILCKYTKLRMLVTSLTLEQINKDDAVIRQEDIMSEITCKTKWYIILMLSLPILDLVLSVIL